MKTKSSKMKNVFCILLVSVLIFMPIFSYAAEDVEVKFTEQELLEEIRQVSAAINEKPKINSRAVVVIEKNTGVVLYEKNMNQKRAMASTTKIMTALIVLENTDVDQIVEVSKKAANTGRIKIRA